MAETAEQRQRAALEEAFEAAKEAQTEFWDALRVLESLVGHDLSADDDLSETDVDTLLAEAEEDAEGIEPEYETREREKHEEKK